MIRILVYLVFIISVAMAAGGIVLSSKLRSRFRNDIFAELLYFQVFIFTFGFYGIWGQALINVLLSSYLSSETLTRFTDTAMLLGLPFLVFAWLMLIRFACRLSGRNSGRWFIPVFLFLNFSLIVAVGYLMSKTSSLKPSSLLMWYFAGMNFIYSVAAFFILLIPAGKPLIHSNDRRSISLSILAIMLMQCIPLLFYSGQIVLALVIIILFFGGNTFLPVYLSYGTALPEVKGESVDDASFEHFCEKFEISPRETDIIREICNGLSNKEISDKLFISLQTVKDHTHRIYIKTNVKSRMQLMNMVKSAGTR